jgi:hypothetical protein
MTSKIAAILAAALVLGSARVSSAQTNRQRSSALRQLLLNQDKRNLPLGHANDRQFYPYAGTVWEGLRHTKFWANCSGSCSVQYQGWQLRPARCCYFVEIFIIDLIRHA